MRVSDLERLYDYNYWANKKLFSVVSQLTPEQFTQAVAGSYESVRNTLVHVLSAEWGWLDRCGGPPRGEKLKAENFATADSVIALWARAESHGPRRRAPPARRDSRRPPPWPGRHAAPDAGRRSRQFRRRGEGHGGG